VCVPGIPADCCVEARVGEVDNSGRNRDWDRREENSERDNRSNSSSVPILAAFLLQGIFSASQYNTMVVSWWRGYKTLPAANRVCRCQEDASRIHQANVRGTVSLFFPCRNRSNRDAACVRGGVVVPAPNRARDVQAPSHSIQG
jgi:hypothetical protein